MPLNDRSKLNRLESLKSKLYSKNYNTEVGHHDHFAEDNSQDVPDSWSDEAHKGDMTSRFFSKTSLFKKLFIFSLGFFALAVLYASYTFFVRGNTVSNNNIDISIVGNSFASGGEDLPLQVNITNKNTSALLLVDLVIEYPKSSSSNLADDTERIRESLGTIPAGAVRTENVRVVLFGEQGSIRPIKVSIEYRVEGSNAIFIKDKTYEVNISSTPIDLSVDMPTEISPNQDIVMKIKTTLNSTRPASKVLVKVNYPVGFIFSSSNPAPAFGNNVWNLGDLSPGATRNIEISGKMVGVYDGEEKTFHVSTGSQSTSDKSLIGVVFNAANNTLIVKRPSVEANLYVNGTSSREYAINTQSSINAEIRWANNLNTKINDLEIRVKLSGNTLDRKSVSVQRGFYNSTEDVIVWDKNSEGDFREVNPGDSGSVSFSMSPSSLLSLSSGFISDPTINVEVSISGKQSESGYATQTLRNSYSSIIRIISDAGIATKALYYTGAFTNTGALPPKAESPTTYTIVWTLSNTANNISKAMVRSSLPAWVDFTNKISPASANLVYNSSTKEIVWNIGNIPRGSGISGGSKEVSFQVKLTPSLSQIGFAPVLINEAVLTGHDDFANVDIRVNKAPLTTRLINDPSAPLNSDRVVE